MSKKRGLGKGLNALLGANEATDQSITEVSNDELEHVKPMDVALLKRGRYQPRQEFDPNELEELAESIRRQGVIQPLVVRDVGQHFEIVAGERRWRAAQIAGLTEVPCLVREINDHQAAAIGLIENLQRANLNPIEESAALERLQIDFGLTHQEIADVVGRSRAAVSNLLRLGELEQQVREWVNQGLLDMGHARALLAIKGSDQVDAAKSVIEKELNVRQTEAFVQNYASPNKPSKIEAATPNYDSEAAKLSKKFELPAAIKVNAKGRGKLELSFKNEAELQALLERLV
ncbi:MAG: ParB/RepB/Spo0J family partition protein [Gammaproteobacteria bacterium]|nr:ParB/RepB/Spo0J family partition protein [Gammaproteobacteria bacterium]